MNPTTRLAPFWTYVVWQLASAAATLNEETNKRWIVRRLIPGARILLAFAALNFGNYAEAKKYKGRLVPGVWQSSWSETLNTSLQDSKLLQHNESQIEDLCPGYGTDPQKRMVFWQQLLRSLGWKESLYGPDNYVRFNGGVNDGLYQINPRVRTYYGCAGYDLFNPQANIECAVKMADKLVAQFGGFLVGEKGGMAAYWQPLRATNKLNTKNRLYILSLVTQACATGNVVYHCPGPHSHTFADDESEVIFNDVNDLGIDSTDLEPESFL